jgi:hypothetical protein
MMEVEPIDETQDLVQWCLRDAIVYKSLRRLQLEFIATNVGLTSIAILSISTAQRRRIFLGLNRTVYIISSVLGLGDCSVKSRTGRVFSNAK